MSGAPKPRELSWRETPGVWRKADKPSRRHALVGGWAAACAVCSATGAAPAARRGDWIDVHHHVFPATYLAKAPARMRAMLESLPSVSGWTPTRALAAMDRDGVRCAILSFPTPRAWSPAVNDQRALARSINDYFAGLVAQYPRRFGLFAGLPPLTDIDGVLAEIDYAFDALKADGVRVMTVYGDKWLGDPGFAPVWDALNRRKSVVFVHPDTGDCCSALPNIASLELPLDTARAAASLWQSQALTRWPDIRFILSHGGGALPMIAGRLRDRSRLAGEPETTAPDPLALFRQLYFDTANAATPPALAGLLALAGPDRVMFGTDAPFVTIDRQIGYLEAAGLSRQRLAGIASKNAIHLIPRLAPR